MLHLREMYSSQEQALCLNFNSPLIWAMFLLFILFFIKENFMASYELRGLFDNIKEGLDEEQQLLALRVELNKVAKDMMLDNENGEDVVVVLPSPVHLTGGKVEKEVKMNPIRGRNIITMKSLWECYNQNDSPMIRADEATRIKETMNTKLIEFLFPIGLGQTSINPKCICRELNLTVSMLLMLCQELLFLFAHIEIAVFNHDKNVK